MTFGMVMKRPATIGIFDDEDDFKKVAELHFSQDDHGTRLMVEFLEEGKQSRIIRL